MPQSTKSQTDEAGAEQGVYYGRQCGRWRGVVYVVEFAVEAPEERNGTRKNHILMQKGHPDRRVARRGNTSDISRDYRVDNV